MNTIDNIDSIIPAGSTLALTRPRAFVLAIRHEAAYIPPYDMSVHLRLQVQFITHHLRTMDCGTAAKRALESRCPGLSETRVRLYKVRLYGN